MSVWFSQGYEGVRESLASKKKNSVLTQKSVDSNMNKKNKKKKEEETELPSKKNRVFHNRSSLDALWVFVINPVGTSNEQIICLVLSVQPYHTTSPSTLDWRRMQAPPAGLMSSSSGLITPRQRGCGWTCQTAGKAFRPALWRASSLTVQMWGRSKRLRWVRGERFSFTEDCGLTWFHTETHRKIHPRCSQ